MPRIPRAATAEQQAAAVDPTRRWFRPPPPPFGVDGAPRYRQRRRDLLMGIAAGLLLTASVAYYAVNTDPISESAVSRSNSAAIAPVELKLKVAPAYATVTLDGVEIGPTDSFGAITFELLPGDVDGRILEISAPGHHSLRQPVSAFLGAPEALISLMHTPYELAVTTDPPDAEVWINGELRGLSPLALMMDPSIEADLMIRRNGFVTRMERIEPPQNDAALAFSYELQAAGQILAVVTEPTEATIRIDGQLKGVSPLRIELDASHLGRTIEISATKDGYENARMHVGLPEEGGGDVMSASLALVRMPSRLNVYTDPPGGRVVISGRDFGVSPVQADFNADEAGRTVLIEASMGGTHFGRQEVTIPPASAPALVMIPMTFGAQRVVFAVGIPLGMGADQLSLCDEIADRISVLEPTQRFAILAATANGIESWPGGLAMEAASSEQKVRAYDFLRGLRPTADTLTDALLHATTAFEPTNVWIGIEGTLEPAALDRYSETISAQQISVNILRVTPLSDVSWFGRWTTAHRGMLVLRDNDQAPAVAVDTSPGVE